jgi:hypothetical protein
VVHDVLFHSSTRKCTQKQAFSTIPDIRIAADRKKMVKRKKSKADCMHSALLAASRSRGRDAQASFSSFLASTMEGVMPMLTVS